MVRRLPHDDEVIVLIRQPDGFDEDYLSLRSSGNILPNAGDKITLHPPFGGLAAYEVKERYLTSVVPSTEDALELTTWVLIVDQIDSSDLSKYDLLIREIHKSRFSYFYDDTTMTPEEFAVAETLDRDNRDPEYWTLERKELLRMEREARLAKMRMQEDEAKD